MTRRHSLSADARSETQAGFTLIEVAIVLAIIGLLLVPFLNKLNLDLKESRIEKTRANINVVDQALKKFALRYGQYPRPAEPAAVPGDANYGLSIPVAVYPPCTPNILVACQTPGRRDTLADIDAVNDPVLIGSVPFATLGIPAESAMDGFSERLTYAVSNNLVAPAAPANFDDDYGVIGLADNNGVPLNSSDDGVHYIVVSHGPDHRGAVSIQGIIGEPCLVDTLGREYENCDNDALFDDGTITYVFTNPVFPFDLRDSRVITRSTDAADPTLEWDDYYAYTISLSSDIWTPIANMDDIRSSNTGTMRVNVSGTNVPDSRVRVEIGGEARADRIYTANLGVTADPDPHSPTPPGDVCKSGDYCLSPDTIGRPTVAIPPTPSDDAPGIRCSSKTAMTGIARGNQVCGAIKVDTSKSVATGSCAAGLFPYGIDEDGNILCKVP